MYLALGIVALAAASVMLYHHLQRSSPDLAVIATRRATQLAAVLVVVSRAVEGVVDALVFTTRPEPVLAGRASTPSSSTSGRPLVDLWEDLPEDEDDYR